MSQPELTKEIAYKALQTFFDQKPFVLFATGTSCAVDIEFGMGALERHLNNKITPDILTAEQASEWNAVLGRLDNHGDFESAMDGIKDHDLLNIVLKETALCVSNAEQKHALNVLQGSTRWPAIEIVNQLTNKFDILHIATPNYDLLAEYAFTHAEILYTTGFWGGVIRILDWGQAVRQMTYAENVSTSKTRMRKVTRFKKHIRLYKVHGSLNTYVLNGQVIETDAWHNNPNDVERLIITPGMAKHEKLHKYRDILLKKYDSAVAEHTAFLFLGFGFNDNQLVMNAINPKLVNHDCPALIITRDSNPQIERLLRRAKNTWLVCKNQHDGDDATRIFNTEYKNWLTLPDKRLWQFDAFATEIMGG